MPSEDQTRIAVDAIRTRLELYHSAVAATTEQIRGLLAGTGETPEDQTIALGNFASGHVDVERFSAFTRQAAKIGPEAELPIRAALRALEDLLHMGDGLFVWTWLRVPTWAPRLLTAWRRSAMLSPPPM